MDDPWGSPWATDDAPPKIDLPTAPPPVIANGAGTSRRSTVWGNDDDGDDAWGGWNDPPAAGASSPGWGRSPGLRPAPTAASRDVSPGPWEKRSEGRTVDSAISLGKDTAGPAVRGKTPPVAFDAQDVWQADEPVAVADEAPASPVVVETPTRSESPDIPPPGPALRPDERPELLRQGSKVQGLVEMYDGISRRSVSPGNPEAVASPREIRTSTEVSEDESPISRMSSLVSIVQKEPAEVLDNESFQNGVSPHDTSYEKEILKEDSNTEDQAPRPKAPAITIPIDLSKLDDLFPSVPAPNPHPEPLPDVIIDDTFTSISERKTWYRISRFGPMRKHNMGNDDNYVRMDWANSTVRVDTLKIVRRWMEEDSIAGRVVLGGRQKGAIGASMFNWDSAAPPTEIGELLGRKKGHSKEPSVGSRRTSGASPAVATFGWSSPAASPTTTSFPPVPEPQTAVQPPPKSRPQSLIMPPVSALATNLASRTKQRPQSLIMPPPGAAARPSIDQALAMSLASPPAAPSPLQASMKAEEEDDDDDWGEMVSSPTVPTSNTFQNLGLADSDLKGADQPSSPPPPVGIEDSTISQHHKEVFPGNTEPGSNPWGSSNLDILAGGQMHVPQSRTALPIPETHTPNTHSQPTAVKLPTTTSPPLQSPKAPSCASPAILSPESQEDDKTVARILNSLPDLTYMLK